MSSVHDIAAAHCSRAAPAPASGMAVPPGRAPAKGLHAVPEESPHLAQVAYPPLSLLLLTRITPVFQAMRAFSFTCCHGLFMKGAAGQGCIRLRRREVQVYDMSILRAAQRHPRRQLLKEISQPMPEEEKRCQARLFPARYAAICYLPCAMRVDRHYWDEPVHQRHIFRRVGAACQRLFMQGSGLEHALGCHRATVARSDVGCAGSCHKSGPAVVQLWCSMQAQTQPFQGRA